MSRDENHRSVPLLDLITPHLELQAELTNVFHRALSTAGFIGGEMVEDFETRFAQYCGTKHCIGVGSGTDALRFAIIAGGIGHGDAVITAPNTFIATGEAISQSGATPVFVDVDQHTGTLDPVLLRSFLESRCRRHARDGRTYCDESGLRIAAIVPVHLYGHMADMDPLMDLAAEFGLQLIEDACQAHGAKYFSRKTRHWHSAGSMGRAAAFSFYPGKNLGACGEAGAVTTNDDEVARKIRMLRDHGQSRKYRHDIEGYNGRLDAIQAGILSAKLPHLDRWNDDRRRCATRYDGLFLSSDQVIVPDEAAWAYGVFHLYVIRVERRDELIAELARHGIGTGIHYPTPLHLQKAYAHLGYKEGAFPVSEMLSREIISLPMFPTLTGEQQRFVAEKVLETITRTVAKAAAGD